MIAEHLERQFVRRSEHLHLGGEHFDCSGRQFRILGAARSPANLAINPDNPLRANGLGELEGLEIVVDDNLGQPVMVAQIDKQHSAMVANAVAPARQADHLANVIGAQRAARMGSIAMHETRALNRRGKAHGAPDMSRKEANSGV